MKDRTRHRCRARKAGRDRTWAGAAPLAVALVVALAVALVVASPAWSRLADAVEGTGRTRVATVLRRAGAGFGGAAVVHAAPRWNFPWSYGESARVSCGYGCYYHQGISYYGLDFNWGGSRNADCGHRVLATANGYVTRSSCSDWMASSGYGCHVELWHAGGPRSFYAHLQEGSAVPRRHNVCLGSRIGRVGDTGRGASTCHLHFHMSERGRAYKPEPMYGRRSGPCTGLTGLGVGTYVSCTGWGCQNPQ